MSNVYTLEPPTSGKVVLRTTLGDIDIELWPKEAPRAVRNFVQLCLEGYYDGTLFHRVIKDFMVQGGDPTGTGSGGESIYGHPFKDEFHTRLKFNHRGLVASANQNKPDTNGSQFFLTLDRADHCDRKYTVFGKVTGDTIYNLMRFNELEVDDNDRPMDPPRVVRADVLWNPFDDIKPRVDRDAKEAAVEVEKAQQAQREKKERKAAKNFKLISFGEEAEEEEAAAGAAAAGAGAKIRSAHDVLEDERLSKEAALQVDLEKVREAVRAAKRAKRAGGALDEAAPSDGQEAAGTAADGPDSGDGEAAADAEGGGGGDFDARMRAKLAGRRRELGHEPQQQAREKRESGGGGGGGRGDGSEGAGPGAQESHSDSGDDTQDAQRSRLAERPQGRKTSAAVVLPSKQIRIEDAELLTGWERKRQEYKQRKRLGGDRQKATLARLAKFAASLQAKPAPTAAATAAVAVASAGAAEAVPSQAAAAGVAAGAAGGEGYRGEVRQDVDHRAYMPAAWRVDNYLEGEEDDDDLASLRQHRLAFVKDARDAMSRSDNVDDYVVVDPLLEAGKAKFNKQVQRQKKRENEWAGRSLT
ncbi:hypothetical protein N2152v2_009844 [Parachlorella kessleri]